jgi:hypothetical protein
LQLKDEIPDNRFSIELSLASPPTYQQLLHGVIASSSTGYPQFVHRLVNRLCGSLEEQRQRSDPGSSAWASSDGERQRSIDSGTGIWKHRAVLR